MLAGIFVIGIEHHDAPRIADLRRRESNAGRGVHGLHHAVDEAVKTAVDIFDRLGRLLENRIRKLVYFKQRHLIQP